MKDGTIIDVGAIWPEICQVKSLRLEECHFDDENIARTLRNIAPKVESLALFSVCWCRKELELPDYFGDSLKELWVKNCWPCCWTPTIFILMKGLCSLHLDWCIFLGAASFVPPNLLQLSISISKDPVDPPYYYERFPHYHDLFEVALERVSQDLPLLQVIQVQMDSQYSHLKNEMEICMKLSLQCVRLDIKLINWPKSKTFLSLFVLLFFNSVAFQVGHSITQMKIVYTQIRLDGMCGYMHDHGTHVFHRRSSEARSEA